MSTDVSPLNPRTRTIILLQGEDQDRLDELDAEVDRLEAAAKRATASRAPATLDEADPLPDARAELEAFAAEAQERGEKVVVRAVGRKVWRELVGKHGPRDGNDNDKAVGVNEDTFPDALVPACIASPVFTSEVKRDEFLDGLSSAQFDQIYYTAFALNRTTGADPKAKRH